MKGHIRYCPDLILSRSIPYSCFVGLDGKNHQYELVFSDELSRLLAKAFAPMANGMPLTLYTLLESARQGSLQTCNIVDLLAYSRARLGGIQGLDCHFE